MKTNSKIFVPIGHTLYISATLYKQHFISLMKLVLLHFLIILGGTLAEVTIGTSFPKLLPVLPLLSLIVYFYAVKVDIMTMVYILRLQSTDGSIDFSLKELWGNSKGRTWLYIWMLIGYSICVGLGILIIATGYLLVLNTFMKALIIILGSIMTLFLLTVYFFSPYLTLLAPDSSSFFKESMGLVKRNPIYVFLLVLLINIPNYGILLLTSLIRSDSLMTQALIMLSSLFLMVLMPLLFMVVFNMYRFLISTEAKNS